MKLCMVCKKREAKFNCNLCGSFICEECSKNGTCKDCLSRSYGSKSVSK